MCAYIRAEGREWEGENGWEGREWAEERWAGREREGIRVQDGVSTMDGIPMRRSHCHHLPFPHETVLLMAILLPSL